MPYRAPVGPRVPSLKRGAVMEGRKKIARQLAGFIALILMLFCSRGAALEPESCKKVRISDVGWTDITATTAVASLILEKLGYDTEVMILSVPVTFVSMKNGEIDLFLGNWMPSMEGIIKPYLAEGTIEAVRANLKGAKYTLAVPDYTYEKGLKSFRDIAKFKGELDGKIYGIEAGNDGNRLILNMIDKNLFQLKDFELISSSEQGMLAQVARKIRQKQDILFLAWEPHPMNLEFKISYLKGGDRVFGPNFGEATVYTVVRSGYTEECPNVGRFLKNLAFTTAMEEELMNAILVGGKSPDEAAREWLKAHPERLKGWLEGVKTADGKEAFSAVKDAL